VTDPRPDLVVWDEPRPVSRRVLAPLTNLFQKTDPV
jgi:hypothetical protein